MPFPKAKRYIYYNNPLDGVICQLRFPTILQIETSPPTEFQKKIIKDYPTLIVKKEGNISMDIRRNIFQLQEKSQDFNSINNYEFLSKDGKWKINLTQNFIALSTSDYTTWDDFKKRLEKMFKGFISISSYPIPFFNRIGLRYIDIFRPSKYNMKNVEWYKLLQPHILGTCSSPAIRKEILHYENISLISLPDGISTLRLYSTFVQPNNSNEQCFMIDSDFFLMKEISKNEIISRLNFFNEQAKNFFHWSIKSKLHEAMGPRTV